MRYGTLGIIGKFQPPTIGHQSLLEAVANASSRMRIGIGSVNRYDAHRPFYPDEVEDMLTLALKETSTPYDIVRIPDYGHKTGNSDAWVEHMRREFRGVDALVSGNPYVEQLLAPHMRIVSLDEIIPFEHRVIASSTSVRQAIATSADWKRYLQSGVARYIDEHTIDERIRREFGEELRSTNPPPITVEEERRRILGAAS